MTYTLLTFNQGRPDEFDVFGFAVVPAEQWARAEEALEAARDEGIKIVWCFGDNEGFENESPDFWLNSIKVKELTSAEHEVLIKSFGEIGPDGLGNFPSLDVLLDGLPSLPQATAYWDFVNGDQVAVSGIEVEIRDMLAYDPEYFDDLGSMPDVHELAEKHGMEYAEVINLVRELEGK